MKLSINDLLFKNFQTYIHQYDFNSINIVESQGSQTKLLKNKNIVFGQQAGAFFGKNTFNNQNLKTIEKLIITDLNYLSIFLKMEKIQNSLKLKTLKTISYKNKDYFINYLKKDFEIIEENFSFYSDFKNTVISYILADKEIFISAGENEATTKTHIKSKSKKFDVDYLVKPTRSASQG